MTIHMIGIIRIYRHFQKNKNNMSGLSDASEINIERIGADRALIQRIAESLWSIELALKLSRV